jgi:hypothetical protein
MSIARGVPFVRVASSMLVSVWGAVLFSLGGCVTPSSGDDETDSANGDTADAAGATTGGTTGIGATDRDYQGDGDGSTGGVTSGGGQTDTSDIGGGPDGTAGTEEAGGTSDDWGDTSDEDATTGPVLEPGCVLDVYPGSVNFANVPLKLGVFGEKVVKFTNKGDADCVFVSFGKPSISQVALAATAPNAIPAGTTLEVAFRLTPTALGPVTGQLDLALASGTSSTPTILFFGTGVAPGVCKLTMTPPMKTKAGAPAPSYLNFGAVALGGTATLPITFAHAPDSADSCEITTAIFGEQTDAAFSWVGTPSFPSRLYPGQTRDLLLKYSPTNRGAAGGQGGACDIFGEDLVCGDNWIRFTTSAANEPVVPEPSDGEAPCSFPGFPPGCVENGVGTATGNGWFVRLNGEGVVDPLVCLPSAVSFSAPTVGCAPPEETVTCYNNALTDVRVTGWTTDKPTIFEALGSTPAPATPGAAITLAPGGNLQIRLRYLSTSARRRTGVLRVFSPVAPNVAGAVEIPLAGAGGANSPRSETFTLPTKSKVDMLWAVDNSGSMSAAQATMATSVPTFVDAVSAATADFHIGVTTSEVNSAYEAFGVCAGNVAPGLLFHCLSDPRWVEPATPNLAEVLSASLQPGGCCSESQEAVLEAARLALSEPNLSDPALNGGFYREDADLALMLVTDEQDQSNGSVDFYVDFFRSLKGARNRDRLSVSIIAGLNSSTLQPEACSRGSASGEAATRLHEFFTKIGRGEALSICDSDWGLRLASLTTTIFSESRARWLPLNATPDPATITVKKGTTTVPKDTTSSGNGWTYDSELNEVVLGAKTTGLAGATITVTYVATCL